MRTILEIQKLERQIRYFQREVDKCPASLDFKKYKRFLQEGKLKFEQLEKQASEIVTNYNKALTKFSNRRGEGDILRKSCTTGEMNLEDTSKLLSEANSLTGELSEENRKMEDMVRRASEIVRRSQELSNKLTEAKSRANAIKLQIEQKRLEVAPKIEELQAKIAGLESKVKDKEKYQIYLDMKAKDIFPVYVKSEDNFCGGCKVELPLNFIEKLKTKKYLPCEHCGRIIMYDKD